MKNNRTKKKDTEVNRDYMFIMSKRYNRSLIKSGYPTNTHVYDINLTFLEKKTQIEKLLKAITKESNNEETKTY